MFTCEPHNYVYYGPISSEWRTEIRIWPLSVFQGMTCEYHIMTETVSYVPN